MADTLLCVPQCCSTPQPVNVPGVQGEKGDPGTNGTNGINAFTLTTADFVIPAINNNVTIQVANSSWAAIGQNIFISDGTNLGNFSVVSIPNTNSITVQFLGYTNDSAPGATISSGAIVSPAGQKGADGTNGFTVAGAIDAAVGGSQALTTTPNTQVLGKTLTLAGAAGKTYLLFARCRFDYAAATFAANQLINFKLRRTNNTAADVANAVGNLETQIITTKTFTAGEIAIIAIPYTTQGVSDVIQPMASIDSLPGAGAVNAVECSITAVELT